MGLLEVFKQYVRDAMPGGLLNPEVAQLPGLLNAQANATANTIKAKGQSFKRGLDDPQKHAGEALAAGMDMAGMAPLGLTVWHGSPHKFNKFDMSKIGTGEGAQAYGHGLYMAESQDVAKTYANNLGITKKLSEGQFNPDGTPNRVYQAAYQIDAGVPSDEILDGLSVLGHSEKESLDILRNAQKLFSGIGEKGSHTYKVDIPDEAVARMLDWDKPLSQQAPEVVAALERSKNKHLRSMIDYAKTPYSEAVGGEEKTMGEAFRLLNLNLQGKSSADSIKASALLAKQGIPGIRYLDGGSRSAGQGSSNFVLFDDQMPRILEINGQPTGQMPWLPNEWKGLLAP